MADVHVGELVLTLSVGHIGDGDAGGRVDELDSAACDRRAAGIAYEAEDGGSLKLRMTDLGHKRKENKENCNDRETLHVWLHEWVLSVASMKLGASDRQRG